MNLRHPLIGAALLLVAVLGDAASAGTSPWPCPVVRWYHAHYTHAELMQKAKDNGIKLTADELAGVRACLRKKS